jgi:hypothetical protein
VDPLGQRSIGKADLVAANAQFSWPPAFSFLAVSVQDLTAADTWPSSRRRRATRGNGKAGKPGERESLFAMGVSDDNSAVERYFPPERSLAGLEYR